MQLDAAGDQLQRSRKLPHYDSDNRVFARDRRVVSRKGWGLVSGARAMSGSDQNRGKLHLTRPSGGVDRDLCVVESWLLGQLVVRHTAR